MSFASEFREFAVKGNVVDLAVGVIIGAAFGKIVDSLVKDLIMPVIGRDLRRPRLLELVHHAAAARPPGYSGPMTYEALTKAGVPLFAYGNFITVAINFVILAFIIFLMVKQINRLKRAEPAGAAAAPPEEVHAAARDSRFAEALKSSSAAPRLHRPLAVFFRRIRMNHRYTAGRAALPRCRSAVTPRRTPTSTSASRCRRPARPPRSASRKRTRSSCCRRRSAARRSTGSCSTTPPTRRKAVTNTRKLITEDKVDVIVGSTITPNSLAMVDVVADARDADDLDGGVGADRRSDESEDAAGCSRRRRTTR